MYVQVIRQNVTLVTKRTAFIFHLSSFEGSKRSRHTDIFWHDIEMNEDRNLLYLHVE